MFSVTTSGATETEINNKASKSLHVSPPSLPAIPPSDILRI